MKLPLVTLPPLQVSAEATLERPFVIYNEGSTSPLVLVCDHASNSLPAGYDHLGVDPRWFREHIAIDIGAACVTERLSHALQTPAILCAFSRLLIDPNRMVHDPTLIPEVSDNVEIPGNRNLSAEERQHRILSYHDTYHRGVDRVMRRLADSDIVPAYIGIHSFTPSMQGIARPWEVAILWNRDDRLATYMVDWLRHHTSFTVGENEPYAGHVAGYSMDRHGGGPGYPHVVIEIRQDLIGDHLGVAEWSDTLGRMLTEMLLDLAPFTPMAEDNPPESERAWD